MTRIQIPPTSVHLEGVVSAEKERRDRQRRRGRGTEKQKGRREGSQGEEGQYQKRIMRKEKRKKVRILTAINPLNLVTILWSD